jgi:RHS repeat-associated protein
MSIVDYGKDNQLQSVVKTVGTNEAYNLNALGIQAGWTTDPLDKRRVLSDGVYQYQYDDEGNLTRKQEISSGKVTAYAWDYHNRLSRVNLSDGSIVEYGYDAEDRRVSKKINGVVKEKYVYDGEDIALVVNAAGTLLERYLYGDGTDNVLSVVKAGTTVWSLADRQGSIVDLVDESGNILNHFVYDSFGNRTQATGVDFRFGYTGRELDSETGLYYYRARYYDAGLGRFISEDPIGFSAGDTNLYRYVNNSPTNFTDPSGNLKFESNPLMDALNFGSYFFNNNPLLGTIKNGINIGSMVSGNGAVNINPFDNAKGGLQQLQQLPGFDKTKFNINVDAGEKYGDAAAQYYSQKFNDSNTPLWQKPGYLAGGLLSSLWTTETSNTTFEVLSTALFGAKDIQKLGLLAEGKFAGLKLGGAFDGLTNFERVVESGIARATSVAGDVWNQIQLNSTLSPLKKQYPELKWNMQSNAMTKEEAKNFVANVQNNDISKEMLRRANIDASGQGYKINVNIWNQDKIPKSILADTSMIGGEFTPTYNDNMIQSLIRQYSPVKIFLNDAKTRLSVDLYPTRALKLFQEEVLGRASGVTIDRATNYSMVHEFTHVRQFLGDKTARISGYLPKTVSSEFKAFSNETKAFNFDLGNKYPFDGDLPYNVQARIANMRLSPYAKRSDYINDMESELQLYSRY